MKLPTTVNKCLGILFPIGAKEKAKRGEKSKK